MIPQGLAYAGLAGLPEERGLWVAALAPLGAVLLASSPYLQTGPTAITSLLTFGALSALAVPGGGEYVALAALLAVMVGGLRIVMGLAGGGGIAYLLSQPVIVGFTTGAAVVIVASRVPVVLGVAPSDVNPLAAAVDAVREPDSWNLAAIGVAVATAAAMLAGRRLHRLFPGVVAAVLLATVAAGIGGYDGPVVGRIDSGLPPLSLDLPWGAAASLLVPALVIALVGFAEPASIARHYATLERRKWDANRELMSQGMANVVAGLGGGFPAGGSFARTALIRDGGGRTRMAAAFSGVVVLALLPLVSWLEKLPTAALGAVIIVAVRDMLRVSPLLELRRYARLQFAVAVATLVLTVALTPHVERALIAGVGLAVAAHLWRELRLSIPAWTTDGVLHLAPRGVLYFASVPGLERAFTDLLGEHSDAGELVIHLGGLGRVDLTGALALKGLLDDARAAGLEVRVVDVPPPARKILDRVLRDAGDHGPAA